MKNIHVIVRDKIAVCPQRDAYIVCMNKVNEAEDSGYQIVFRFDAEWDKYTKKTARFVWNGEYFDKKFEGNVCPVPVITGTDVVEVGVYAGDLSTTTSAKIPCKESVLCKTSKPSDGAIKEYRDEAAKFADRAEESAENAKRSADDAARSASGAVLSAESASSSARQAVESAENSAANAEIASASAEETILSAEEAAGSAREAHESALAAAKSAEEAVEKADSINTDLENYLQRTGGEITGVLYTSASDPLLVGKNGKVGMRANISSDDGDKHVELLVSSGGVECVDEAGTAYKVLHSGNTAVPNGLATLDENGHIPSTQLPSYIDSVVEGYISTDKTKFYEDKEKTKELISESNRIYIDLDSLCSYRWGGTRYAEISESLALGETANTAFYGDKGKEAYEHSQKTSGNPHGVTAEDVKALPITGGTMQGNINFGTNRWIEGTTASGGIFSVFGLITPKRLQVGGSYPALELVGEKPRPTYNGTNIVLVSDIGAFTAKSDDGVSYTVDVPFITATKLEQLKGVSIVIIPNKESTTASNVTLNVNGLGAAHIKRWDNLDTGEWWSFKTTTWFRAGYPIRIMYNGTYWIIEGMNKPRADDLYGVQPETWTFTLEDGSTVDKVVYVG